MVNKVTLVKFQIEFLLICQTSRLTKFSELVIIRLAKLYCGQSHKHFIVARNSHRIQKRSKSNLEVSPRGWQVVYRTASTQKVLQPAVLLGCLSIIFLAKHYAALSHPDSLQVKVSPASIPPESIGIVYFNTINKSSKYCHLPGSSD